MAFPTSLLLNNANLYQQASVFAIDEMVLADAIVVAIIIMHTSVCSGRKQEKTVEIRERSPAGFRLQ